MRIRPAISLVAVAAVMTSTLVPGLGLTSATADQLVTIPGVVPAADGVTYRFTLPTGGAYTFGMSDALPVAAAGTQEPYLVCPALGWSRIIVALEAGTYTLTPATRSGPISVHRYAKIPNPGSLFATDLKVFEKEGALELAWTPPTVSVSELPECSGDHQFDAQQGGSITVSKNGEVVGAERATNLFEGRAVIDGLETGTSYDVKLSIVEMWSRMVMELTSSGTPRIPSALVVDTPNRVAANDVFPVSVTLDDNDGQPIPNAPVSIRFQPSGAQASAASAKILKRVHTNSRGVAATKVKLRRTGRLVAVFKDRGRHAGIIKSKVVKVRGN